MESETQIMKSQYDEETSEYYKKKKTSEVKYNKHKAVGKKVFVSEKKYFKN